MRRFWLAVVVALLLGGFVANWDAAFAQEPAAPDTGAPAAVAAPAAPEAPAPAAAPAAGATVSKGDSWFMLVWKYSGVPGWLIILCSFIAVYLFARYAYYFRHDKMLPPEFVRALEDDLANRRVREAIEKCNLSDTVLARVTKAGLMQMRNGYDEMVRGMQEQGELESMKLFQQVGWLNIIAAVAPMLGLLGTVLGMIGAFGQIAVADIQPAPKDLAANIEFALVTTAEGLYVAIPVLTAYAIARNQVASILDETGSIAGTFIDNFKGIEITPAMWAGVAEAAAAGSYAAAPAAPAAPPLEAPPPEEGAPPPPPPV